MQNLITDITNSVLNKLAFQKQALLGMPDEEILQMIGPIKGDFIQHYTGGTTFPEAVGNVSNTVSDVSSSIYDKVNPAIQEALAAVSKPSRLTGVDMAGIAGAGAAGGGLGYLLSRLLQRRGIIK